MRHVPLCMRVQMVEDEEKKVGVIVVMGHTVTL